MTKLKLRAITDVHIRSRVPRRQVDNLKGVVFKGRQFEMDVDILREEQCEVIDNNRTWYRDGNGDYLWSGGFKLIEDENTVEYTSLKSFIDSKFNGTRVNGVIDYNSVLQNIPSSVKNSKGNGTIIGILDQPILKGTSFFAIEDVTNADISPRNFHGTAMATIIAGREKIIGIASQAKIFELPAFDTDARFQPELLRRVLDYLDATVQDMVINMSFSATKLNNTHGDLALQLEQIVKKENLVFVAAAGSNDEIETTDTIQYPALINEVIAVGTLTPYNSSDIVNSGINNDVDIIVGHHRYVVHSYRDPTKYRDVGEDSAASAIVSAVIALYLSSGKLTSLDKTSVLNALDLQKLSTNGVDQLLDKLILFNPKL